MNTICKRIIRELQKRSNQSKKDYSCSFSGRFSNLCDTTLESFASDIGFAASDVRSAVKYLVTEGHLEYCTLKSQTGDFSSTYGFRLSHKGKNLRYFENQDIKRYLADKWIDFVALAISIIAFIQSCIALSN